MHEANIVLMSQHDITDLLGETIGAVVLDSGCSETVCGQKWYDCFVDTLPQVIKKGLTIQKSSRTFKFGSGKVLPSLMKVSLPCKISGIRVDIVTDVVNSDIPLLLIKAAMKRAKTHLDFENDTFVMFGRKQKLNCTPTGHYYIPLAKPLPSSGNSSEVLFIKEINNKTKGEKLAIATKLQTVQSP